MFEIDDLLTEVDPSNQVAHSFYDSDKVRRYRENLAVADVVTVTTDRLAEHARDLNPSAEIHVLPNQVPGWMLDHERPAGSDPDLVTIGWRGGPSHDRDFGELARPLKSFLQHPANRGRVEFHSMGVDYTPSGGQRPRPYPLDRMASAGLGLPSRRRLRRGGDPAPAFGLQRLQVGSRPRGDERARDPVGHLGRRAILVGHRGPHIPCSTPAQWTTALRELADDPAHGAQLGKQAREWAATRTIEANVHRREAAYMGT